jgi:3-oxoacyl-[acyl-carrier protein] reductase
VAIITGAGQGIGAAAARLFAREGAKVVVSDLDGAKAESVAASIRADGGSAFSVAGDVTAAEFPEKIMAATIEKWGKLNILVNNAGYTWDAVIHRTTDAQWDAMYKVHCTAPFRLIRAAAPHMRIANSSEPRCIINVSSTSGTHGNAGQINYATAKMGVLGMTKTVAKEWGGFGVRCNAIAFGYIETRLTAAKEAGASIDVGGAKVALGVPAAGKAVLDKLIPLGRSGKPEEAAGALLMLASPHASYISGQCLEVTGGLHI